MKIVINKCHGGFGLSYDATMEWARRKGIELYAFVDSGGPYEDRTYERYDPEKHKRPFIIHYRTTAEWNSDDGSYWSDHKIERDDPVLAVVVQELGEKASDRFAKLEVVEIPDGVEWAIEEYDGMEWVAEQHRTWG